MFLKYMAFNIALKWHTFQNWYVLVLKNCLIRIYLVVYFNPSNKNMFLWFNFWIILNVCIFNTWIAIIKFGGHHASKIGITYSNGGHIGFNYTCTSFTNSLFYYYCKLLYHDYLSKLMRIQEIWKEIVKMTKPCMNFI